MHILFTLNDNYAPHLGALIVSILESQKEDTELNFHIVSFDLSQDSVEKLNSLKAIRAFNIKYYDANDYGVKWDLFKVTLQHITIETYFRLYAHVFLKDIDKVLHLDIDLLVFDDLLPFWNIDLDDTCMAGVPSNTINGMHLAPANFDVQKHTYYLAGSNLLNLKKMRDNNFSDLIFDVVSRYSTLLKFQDQDIMNILFKHCSQNVPLKFNADSSIFVEEDVKEKLKDEKLNEYIEATENPTIMHFSRNIKAWHANSTNPYAKFYKGFLDKTAWKGEYPKPITIKQRLIEKLKAIKTKVLRNKALMQVRQTAQPYLDWYMRRKIEHYLKTSKVKFPTFSGYKKGMTLYSHLSMSDSLFFYFEKMLECHFANDPAKADAVLIWGTKFFGYRHKVLVEGIKHNLPLLLGEDGFIRSINIAASGAPGLSVLLDHTGIYYDASLSCIIDRDLNSNQEITTTQRNEAKRAMSFIRDNHLSKYNMIPEQTLSFDPENKYESIVLVIDQRKGDQSISGAKADETSFKRMLNDAIQNNPNSYILVKTHPDAISGGFEGYFSSYKPTANNICLLYENINPISLLKAVDKVYVVSSQMGIEGLICGKDVYCYGAPFYAGWGLTTDRGDQRERKRARSLEDVFYVAYMKHTFYFCPDTDQQTDIFGLLTYLNRETQQEAQF